MQKLQKYYGRLVDLSARKIFDAVIHVEEGRITEIRPSSKKTNSFILPGFIDSHIHIESSMLTPVNFGKIAVRHGTMAVIADPHEIANIMGLKGINYLLQDARNAKIKFYFGAPSCVPATSFETSGAEISLEVIDYLFRKKNISILSEVMNFPGVISGDKNMLEKIALARSYGLNIDGHAPLLRGKQLQKYIDAGIQTDHEASSLEEAEEKILMGMMIQIREGSAARNFESLHPLIDLYPDRVMFCCDDLHPDDLLKGHINLLVSNAVSKGINLFNVLRTACINPVMHYNLDIGLLRIGDKADFIRVTDLVHFSVKEVFSEGNKIFGPGISELNTIPVKHINNFNATPVSEVDLKVPPQSGKVKVLAVSDGELYTTSFIENLNYCEDDIFPDIKKDILKLSVINRYKRNSKPAVGFVHNFGLQKGALATSIAHDSHNVICVGTGNREMSACINWIIKHKGGIAINDGNTVFGIPLPVAGIISDKPVERLSRDYLKVNQIAGLLGCKLKSPVMTLSFLSLLVIPELKLSDKGLFDVNTFSFTSLYP